MTMVLATLALKLTGKLSYCRIESALVTLRIGTKRSVTIGIGKNYHDIDPMYDYKRADENPQYKIPPTIYIKKVISSPM